VSDDQARRPGESFLAHRARLKAENQQAQAPRSPAVATAEAPPQSAAAAAPEAAPRQLTDADMPPIESLTAESDFAQFLAEGVSDALRRAALRKLFQLPEFGVLDGLNEYDEDYTQFEKLGDMVTHTQRRMQAREAAAREAAKREAELQGETTAPRQEDAAEVSDEAPVAEGQAGGEGPEPDATDEPPEDDGDLQS
jgi:hypothetical protein